jgi:hypothetical protein
MRAAERGINPMKAFILLDSGRLLTLVIGIALAGSAAVANLCGVGAGPAIGIAILLGVALCLASLARDRALDGRAR